MGVVPQRPPLPFIERMLHIDPTFRCVSELGASSVDEMVLCQFVARLNGTDAWNHLTQRLEPHRFIAASTSEGTRRCITEWSGNGVACTDDREFLVLCCGVGKATMIPVRFESGEIQVSTNISHYEYAGERQGGRFVPTGHCGSHKAASDKGYMAVPLSDETAVDIFGQCVLDILNTSGRRLPVRESR